MQLHILMSYRPAAKKILMLCYWISLVLDGFGWTFLVIDDTVVAKDTKTDFLGIHESAANKLVWNKAKNIEVRHAPSQ
jgi:hypothetical protein